MSKTKEEMIKDLTEMNPHMGEWVKYLFEERNMTTQQVIETMQRAITYIENE